ncbi:DNA mismatch endonuclease (patch repair protein) [Actinopolyspora biskrensis]|uniref:DNA mismatch endonuclease (Patch repair protein) n=1 Tax=Actinopolyspora biskrensis TaxID=1470178 RepID=A0A852YWE2_9ACTN|nr:very short patch repair endonuclease [Actinopolyspora biskrensis]NYH77215.1 DNA mismatch endonuclease (patch repair protein) [Actinopolyspora biskrensis]
MNAYQYVDPGPTPPASSAATTKVMRRMRRRDTGPELRLRKTLHRRGLRYLVDVAIPGGNRRRRVDVLLRGPRIAVLVDGCFWHSYPEHGLLPKSNRDWWRRKLEGVVRRDQDTDAEITATGWLVVRVWEHDDPETAAGRIERLVNERKRGTHS